MNITIAPATKHDFEQIAMDCREASGFLNDRLRHMSRTSSADAQAVEEARKLLTEIYHEVVLVREGRGTEVSGEIIERAVSELEKRSSQVEDSIGQYRLSELKVWLAGIFIRRKAVIHAIEQAISRARGEETAVSVEFSAALEAVSNSTGLPTGSERLKAARSMLPSAAAAIEAIIVELEHARGNGGPSLDEVTTSIQELRRLHSVLGDILELADRGELESAYGHNLLSEARDFSARCIKGMKEDPMRFAVLTMVTCLVGFLSGGVGGTSLGIVAGIAQNATKKRIQRRETDA